MLLSNTTTANFDINIARHVGIDEAILLQALIETSQLRKRGKHFVNILNLRTRTPFWNEEKVRVIYTSLIDHSIISNWLTPESRDNNFIFSINKDEIKNSSAVVESLEAHEFMLEQTWSPTPKTMIYIKSNLGITLEGKTLEDYLEEFRTLWASNDISATTKDDGFIRYAYRKFNSGWNTKPESSKEMIFLDWVPTDATMALLGKTMTAEFASNLIQGFISYWIKQQAEKSDWDTVFVKHAREHYSAARASQALLMNGLDKNHVQPSHKLFEKAATAPAQRSAVA